MKLGASRGEFRDKIPHSGRGIFQCGCAPRKFVPASGCTVSLKCMGRGTRARAIYADARLAKSVRIGAASLAWSHCRVFRNSWRIPHNGKSRCLGIIYIEYMAVETRERIRFLVSLQVGNTVIILDSKNAGRPDTVVSIGLEISPGYSRGISSTLLWKL